LFFAVISEVFIHLFDVVEYEHPDGSEQE